MAQRSRIKKKSMTKNDKIEAIINKFQHHTNAIYCSVVDIDGFIIATEKAENLSDTIERHSIVLFNSLQLMKRENIKFLDISKRVSKISLYFNQEYNALRDGLTLLVKSINQDLCAFSVFPAWLDLTLIEVEFVRITKKISKLMEF